MKQLLERLFKPSVTISDILIIMLVTKFITNSHGFWIGLLVIFLLFIISHHIETKIFKWKVSNAL